LFCPRPLIDASASLWLKIFREASKTTWQRGFQAPGITNLCALSPLDNYTALPYRIEILFSFIETALFTRLVAQYLSEQEYGALQQALMTEPEAGAVVPGSGGVRKLRWAAPGRGKRGGYRVIYFVRKSPGIIWMLTMYPKNVADNIPAHVLRQIRKEIEDGQ
jgi:mRNA-degrading endonuclease RelE of RelBE toxin-antitoxin system